MQPKLKALYLEIPSNLHLYLKKLAAREQTTMVHIVRTAIEKFKENNDKKSVDS